VVTAALIQVLVLVLTLAAASGAVPATTERIDATAMVDVRGAAQTAVIQATRTTLFAGTEPCIACRSLTAGRVSVWTDQGRGPMPPPMA
jgi:hypothetical protein